MVIHHLIYHIKIPLPLCAATDAAAAGAAVTGTSHRGSAAQTPRASWRFKRKCISTYPMKMEIFLTKFTEQSVPSRKIVAVFALA